MIELSDLEKKLKTENLSNSEKQILCDQVVKVDKIYAEWIRMMKREDCAQNFEDLSNSRSYYLIKQYRRSKDCGNQTSLVSFKSAGDKSRKETVINIENRAT